MYAYDLNAQPQVLEDARRMENLVAARKHVLAEEDGGNSSTTTLAGELRSRGHGTVTSEITYLKVAGVGWVHGLLFRN